MANACARSSPSKALRFTAWTGKSSYANCGSYRVTQPCASSKPVSMPIRGSLPPRSITALASVSVRDDVRRYVSCPRLWPACGHFGARATPRHPTSRRLVAWPGKRRRREVRLRVTLLRVQRSTVAWRCTRTHLYLHRFTGRLSLS